MAPRKSRKAKSRSRSRGKSQSSRRSRSSKSGSRSRRRSQGSRRRSQSRSKSSSRRSSDRPRRSLSAYMLFIQSCWKEHRAANPGAISRSNFGTLNRQFANRWRKLSASEKQPYVDSAAKDKQRYSAAMSSYKSGRKKSKRPLGSYFLFCADERPKVRQAMPKASVTEVAKELGRRWSQMDPKEKAKYEAQAKSAREQYYKQRSSGGAASPKDSGGPGSAKSASGSTSSSSASSSPTPA